MRITLRAGLPIIVLVLVGCRTGVDRDVNAIRKAMEALIYVGDVADLPGDKVADHGSGRLAFPDRLVKGRQYVFHRRRTSTQSWTAVQNALRANGANILDGPRGNVGLVYTTVGGPWYAIEFRMGRLRCSFQNRAAAELRSVGMGPEMEAQDFILKIE
jgi:hypothetical protein